MKSIKTLFNMTSHHTTPAPSIYQKKYTAKLIQCNDLKLECCLAKEKSRRNLHLFLPFCTFCIVSCPSYMPRHVNLVGKASQKHVLHAVLTPTKRYETIMYDVKLTDLCSSEDRM